MGGGLQGQNVTHKILLLPYFTLTMVRKGWMGGVRKTKINMALTGINVKTKLFLMGGKGGGWLSYI